MENIKFDDYSVQKYQRIESFKEGLAVVQDNKKLYGFINKKGEEVISPKYQNAMEFSEGLAAVQNPETHLWGFINKKGELVIAHKYKDAECFSEGLAAVQDKSMTWEYIDKNGQILFTGRFKIACGFSEGFAVVTRAEYPQEVSFIDKTGKFCATYRSATSFKDGLALVLQGPYYFVINTKFEAIGKVNEKDFRYISGHTEGLFLTKFNSWEYGYLNEELKEVNIPSFDEADNFSEGMARIKLSSSWKGYVTKEGKTMAFSTEQQYKEFARFKEGLAAVQDSETNLWGFINKKGQEIIKCEYEEVDDFSEGLAGVTDSEGNIYYIDKKGNKRIIIPTLSCSVLELDDRTIIISANSKEELAHKKLQLLSILKTEMINEFIKSIDQVAYDETSELSESHYEMVKKRK